MKVDSQYAAIQHYDVHIYEQHSGVYFGGKIFLQTRHESRLCYAVLQGHLVQNISGLRSHQNRNWQVLERV